MNINFLKNMPLFANCSQKTLHDLTRVSKIEEHVKADSLFQASLVQNYFIYVIDGWVKVCSETAAGDEVVIDILNEHHHYGEHLLFPHTAEKNCTFEALSSCQVLIIPIRLLKKLIQNDHQLSLNMLSATLKKQQLLNMEIEHLSMQNAIQRIGCFILRLCVPQTEGVAELKLPYNKSLLATRLGIRNETFSRALAKLCEQCNIEVNSHVLIVNDVKQLSDYVCQHCSSSYPCKL